MGCGRCRVDRDPGSAGDKTLQWSVLSGRGARTPARPGNKLNSNPSCIDSKSLLDCGAAITGYSSAKAALLVYQMQKYTFVVDESGDLGLDKVREGMNGRGASPYLVLGACLIPNSQKPTLRRRLEKLREEVCKHKPLHCSELSHHQNAKLAREVGGFPHILFFSYISKKSTLGSYKGLIEGTDQSEFYFNKCSVYLLEQLALAMEHFGISKHDISIVFEERSHNYQRLRAFLKQNILTPLPTGSEIGDRNRARLSLIDPLSITSQKKENDALLYLADLAAYATRSAIDQTDFNYGVPEQRYFREIESKFFKNPTNGLIGEWGLKVFKPFSAKFDKTTQSFIDSRHTVKK